MVGAILKKTLKYALLILVLYYLGSYLYNNWSRIEAFRYDTDWIFLSGSFLLLMSTLVLLPVSLRSIVRLFHYDIDFKKICLILFYSQFVKYLPGGIWGYVGRVYLYQKEGMPALNATQSVLLETLLMLFTGILVALLSLFYSDNELSGQIIGNRVMRGGAILIFIGFFIAMHPKILNRLFAMVPERFRKKNLRFDYSYHHLLKPTLMLIIFWMGIGGGFWLLIKSFFPIAINLLPVVTGAFILSWIVGMLVFFTPGGLGVREVSLVVLMNICLPAYISAFIAVASRIWWVMGEMVGFLLAYIWNRIGNEAVNTARAE